MAKRPKDSEFEKWMKLGDKHMLSASIYKNQNDEVVLNLRKFFLTKDEAEWRPDKQGMTLHLEQAKKLRKLTKLLEEVQEEAPEPSFGKPNKKKKKDKDEDD